MKCGRALAPGVLNISRTFTSRSGYHGMVIRFHKFAFIRTNFIERFPEICIFLERRLPRFRQCLRESRLPTGFAMLLMLKLLNIVNESLFNGHLRFKISRRDAQQISRTHTERPDLSIMSMFSITNAARTFRLTKYSANQSNYTDIRGIMNSARAQPVNLRVVPCHA